MNESTGEAPFSYLTEEPPLSPIAPFSLRPIRREPEQPVAPAPQPDHASVEAQTALLQASLR